MELKRVVVAIDSFKGSISSRVAGEAAAEAIKSVCPACIITVYPLADGGEGTVDALCDGLGGEIIETDVTGPLGSKVKSRYGYLPAQHTAIIEMADAAGLAMVPPGRRNPLYTTTYGLGELILAACEHGCRRFIIGIGGSATNDAGLGMLTALGAKFYRADGAAVGIYGKDLQDVAQADFSDMAPVLSACSFSIACDVTNPLIGSAGCSAVFGPQKGATPEIVQNMDHAMARFAQVTDKAEIARLAGAGAAGGLGFAFAAFLHGELKPGIELVLDTLQIDKGLRQADLLLTGEGRMDAQSVMGKAPVGIAARAKRLQPDIMTIAVCGSAAADAAAVNAHGIDAYFPILQEPISLDRAMAPEMAKQNLYLTVKQMIHLICINRMFDTAVKGQEGV